MPNPFGWWISLAQNPIYLREKGEWGEPNPFYEKLSRYSPFVVIGALLLGVCGALSNPALLSGNAAFTVFWCLLCLPAILFTALTWFGVLMAPALTAPSISMERDRGTWEMLRATPIPDHEILWAKLFGGLARLPIWKLLFALSLLQGFLIAGAGLFMRNTPTAVATIPLVFAAIFRPWLEIGFAAFMGMFISTWVRSATTALAATYVAVVLVRLFNSTMVWAAVFAMMGAAESIFVASSLGPTAVYALALLLLAWGIRWRAERMSEE
jgi:ABC-type transport system involved in multi-copper enzyme maturation permease subunit